MKLSRWALAAAPLALAACGGFGSAMTSHTDVVAKAAGKELRVEDAAQILAANPQVPDSDPRVVQELADLWVDYTLLATAVAEDTSLKVLNLDSFAEEQRESETVARFLESRVRADTSFTDAELDQLWNTTGPGVEIKARHILLVPKRDSANAEVAPAEQQALRQRAEQIRARAAAPGQDFGALAAETTEEPGGKERGGDLGWFGRGRMVAQFEEAAFQLQPGQVSPVVETPFGFHVIKVEDRRQTPMGENREPFRQHARQQAQQQAMSTYIDSLTKAADLKVQDGAVARMKELAAGDNLSLRGRDASRQLVAFRGGELTAGELAEVLQNFPSSDLAQVKDAPEDRLKGFLEQQAMRDVILAEAEKNNFRLSQAASDSITTNTRQAIREVLSVSGLGGRTFPKGKAGAGAIQEAVRNLMEQVVSGQRQLPRLGPLAYALRNAYENDINDKAFQRVVDRMKAIRASQPAPKQGMPGMPGGMPQGMPEQGAPVQQAPAPRGQQAP
jgi:PPIC-type PPIASE domain